MRRLFGAGAVVLLLATGCSPDTAAGPGESRVAVDTPELRAQKAEIGIRDCVAGTGEPVDGGLPEITLQCLGGGPSVDLSTLRGPLVINLWYAACAPCEKELPALAEFDEEYGDEVPLLGIDSGVWPELELEKARSTGVRYPQLADPGSDLWAHDPFPVRAAYPFLGFIDEDGRMVAHQAGGIESSDELVDLVQQHLGIRL